MTQIDHYFGRKCIGVESNVEGFVITLEGGVKIVSVDSGLPAPENIEGLTLTGQRLSAQWTELIFEGKQRVTVMLNPNRYGIQDSTFGEEIEYPQRSEVSPVPLPEHPDERIADGPEPVERPERPQEAADGPETAQEHLGEGEG